ncbi:MAG: DUF3343 domain-containing protein [Tannerellaceae bacterium]
MHVNEDKIAVFASARMVIKADKLCQQAHLSTKVLSVPEHISSECGMCILVPQTELDAFCRIMTEAQLAMTLYPSTLTTETA